MKQFSFFIFVLLNLHQTYAQIFDKETIRFSGDNDKHINLVILSEGYQESELDKFITDATNFTNAMFSQSPFLEYANYFNVYALKVPSNQSGADHPGTANDVTEPLTPVVEVDTYFNATFDAYGFHRLLYYEIDGNHANNTTVKINTVLAKNFPDYDQALIIVNSNVYGGSGGEFPMSSNAVSASEVAIHELGHSLFNLMDEYYVDDIYAAEGINMTQESDPNLVRWKNWINTNGVNIYQHTCETGNCANWYKPHQNCKMQILGSPFCSVCKEAIIEKIHTLVSPISSYTPDSDTISNPTYPLKFELSLIEPIPNTLVNTWTLNATNIANNVDTVSVLENVLNQEGWNNLTVVVHDATTSLRIDNHETIHAYTVTWNINTSTLGIKDITSITNSFDISIYPNPSNTLVYIKYESLLHTGLKLELTSIDGKKIQSYNLSNTIVNSIDIGPLNHGIYLANFYSNNTLIASKKIAKL